MKEASSIYSKVARVTFYLHFFFTLFGTRIPFQAGTRDPSELGTSNPVNQIVFSVLFLTALFSIIPKTNQIIAILKREKFFLLFLLWCALTLIWAGDSFVVFKRLFRLYTAVLVCLSFIAHADDADDLLFMLKSFFSVFMIVSLVSIFTIPGATGQRLGGWQGLATSKNHLGEASLISTVIWIYAISKDKKLTSQLFNIFMLLVSLFLLFGAQSITAISAFLFLVLIWFLFEIDKIFKPLGLRRTMSALFLIFGGTLMVLTFLYAQDIISSIFALAGKNLTLTGRTDLWADVLAEAKKHLIIGCGYKGFWIVDSPKILELYDTYIWLPRQGHNGYIDTLNETGIIGLFFFLALILNYFISLIRHNQKTFWIWFMLIGVIENFTESRLINAGGLMTLIFIFGYFSVFNSILRKDQVDTESNPYTPD